MSSIHRVALALMAAFAVGGGMLGVQAAPFSPAIANGKVVADIQAHMAGSDTHIVAPTMPAPPQPHKTDSTRVPRGGRGGPGSEPQPVSPVIELAATGTSTARRQKTSSLTFTVSSNQDTNDGSCSSTKCTLRDAIMAANSCTLCIASSFNIVFNIGSGNPSIYVLSPLPALTIGSINILGNTGGATRVQVNGSFGSATTGFTTTGSGNTLSSLAINGFAQDGIDLQSANNSVVNSFIGTTSDGTSAVGNGRYGVLVVSNGNVIAGNVISGNAVGAASTAAGVEISGGSTSGNLVEGNYIGTDSSGASAIGNNGLGVSIDDASGNTIGGTSSSARNVISGNALQGVSVAGTASNDLIEGNFIGTNAAGTAALGNLHSGVIIQSIGSGNVVGGTAAGSRNVISGNGGQGIAIASSGVLVQGNYLGTDASGSSAVGNLYGGVFVSSGSSNAIGGTSSAARNVISGNAYGVFLAGASNTVQGNYIGTNAAGSGAIPNHSTISGIATDGIDVSASGNVIGGTAAGAGNLISGNAGGILGSGNGPQWGISLQAGSDGTQVQGNTVGTDVSGVNPLGNAGLGIGLWSSNNTIGGTSAGAANLISGNGGDGVASLGTGNTFQGNRIGTDVTGSVALGNNANGIHIEGANNVIGGATTGAANLISGNVGNGILSNGTGTTIQGNLIGTDITGSAALGNHASGMQVGGSSNVIGGTASGTGNLVSANGSSTTYTANVYLFGSGGSTVQGNHIGTNLTGTASLAGLGQDGVGINSSSSNTIGGVTAAARNIISGNNGSGVGLFYPTATGNLIAGNYIGTDVTGTSGLGNGYVGILAGNAGGNTIGGTAAGSGNLISGNNPGNKGAGGIYFYNDPTYTAGANNVVGNLVGTDVSGMAALGNTNNAILINNSPNNTIGGMTAAARNVISGNNGDGVFIFGAGAAGNQVLGNYIGVAADGSGVLGNTFSGVGIQQAPNNVVGNTTGGGNVIANNTLAGVRVFDTGAVGDQIRGNSIFGNTGLGIDLGDDGVTVNNPTDPDSGPNNKENFPIVTSSATSTASTVVAGTMNNDASSTITVDIYANTACDSHGYGQGRSLLGSVIVTTDSSGNGAFTFSSTTAIPLGSEVTATATDSGGDTSEFSPCTQTAAKGTLEVSVQDFFFSPAKTTAKGPGAQIQWNFSGPGSHNVTDATGMNLYNSGPKPAGSTFSVTLPAGLYTYQSTGETTPMKGSISVPVGITPPSGTTATTFTVTLAGQAPPAGYVFDVQVERPAATSFSLLTNSTSPTISFSPDAGPGIYSFNARLRNTANGKSSGFSPTKTLTVSMAVTATGFSPGTALIRQGTKFSWLFPPSNVGDHTVTDGTGLGLFDSGFRHPGTTYTFTFTAAGSYRVIDAATGSSAVINVALRISPITGTTTTPFTVFWSSAAPASGYVFDIQVKRPGGSFTDWLVGQTATSAAFTPDAGTGTYTFQARLRNSHSGATSGWSPPTTITVT